MKKNGIVFSLCRFELAHCTTTVVQSHRRRLATHPALLLEEVLQREDHDALVPLLAVPDHRVRLAGTGASIREHGCIVTVNYALAVAKSATGTLFHTRYVVLEPVPVSAVCSDMAKTQAPDRSCIS